MVDGNRPVGAFVVVDGEVRYRPVVDLHRLAGVAAGTVGVLAVVLGVAAATRRPGPAVGSVRMGPGGWLSVRGAPARRAARGRPGWARLLRAYPLSARR
ncbi:hypothetical protein [Plantactinospora sp. KBS50]|uniref:hypothetical protein n=1 Tax=Plantactinospora sp. KBS50 TaxID=2024580 RepID=UPI001E31D0CE|nr:hypothetical protein [Plantactinospora sp. KBS50]